jgi:hypothetical protein
MSLEEPNLEALVALAATASPIERIELRDRIASYGPEAIVAMTPWLTNPLLGAFAVRVMARASDIGAQAQAAAALKQALGKKLPEAVRGDITSELARLRASARATATATARSAKAE